MTDLNDFIYTDGVDDVLAVYVNRLLATALRSEYKDAKTLSADLTLLDADTPIQRINCNGADRIVKAPTGDAVENHPYWVVNATSTGGYKITLKSNDATIIQAVLAPGQAVFILPDGNGKYLVPSATAVTKNTLIEGLTLTWNSATSITIGTGTCYAENGDFIDVTSAVVKSSLSLSASTWYHIYVYLSSGAAAAEVVTTAPVAWMGTAYSKTGDTSRRYVGSILADGSSNVRNFVHNINTQTIHYRKFQSDTSPHRALSGGTATTATAIGLSSIIPATAIAALIRFTNLADKSVYTSEDNGVGTTQNTVALTAGNTATQSAFLPHLVDASLQIWYKFASAVGAGAGYLDVLGYQFQR